MLGYLASANPIPIFSASSSLFALIESLNKRITYLKGHEIISLVEYAKATKESKSSLLNKAKRQTIRAFREKGVWKIGLNS